MPTTHICFHYLTLLNMLCLHVHTHWINQQMPPLPNHRCPPQSRHQQPHPWAQLCLCHHSPSKPPTSSPSIKPSVERMPTSSFIPSRTIRPSPLNNVRSSVTSEAGPSSHSSSFSVLVGAIVGGTLFCCWLLTMFVHYHRQKNDLYREGIEVPGVSGPA